MIVIWSASGAPGLHGMSLSCSSPLSGSVCFTHMNAWASWHRRTGSITASRTMMVMSLPEKPSVFPASSLIWSSETSGGGLILLMWISNILRLARSSGSGIYILFWQRRRTALSMAHGKLVATNTSRPSIVLPKPSICTSSSVLILRELSDSLSLLAVAIESISSMKMIEGLCSLADSNRIFTSFSDSPSHLEVRSAELTERKVASASVATALAR
mmetsp:Transcript_38288/g.59756  ORF Transcript_38288/g.59756 Transcript_38288/m.59756 type:complete len:215 (+) Transcript_38288:216-860(+)